MNAKRIFNPSPFQYIIPPTHYTSTEGWQLLIHVPPQKLCIGSINGNHMRISIIRMCKLFTQAAILHVMIMSLFWLSLLI